MLQSRLLFSFAKVIQKKCIRSFTNASLIQVNYLVWATEIIIRFLDLSLPITNLITDEELNLYKMLYFPIVFSKHSSQDLDEKEKSI